MDRPSAILAQTVDPDRVPRILLAQSVPKASMVLHATFIALVATLNLFRTITFRWSIVIAGSYTLNVADFLLGAMYLTVLFTWTFINTKNSKGLKYDPKYWANRCAHIAGSQLPLMTAFGMKNNFMSCLEHLHRVMARVICVLFWVHGYGPRNFGDLTTEYWFRIGVAVTKSSCIFISLLGVITLAGAYVHSAEFGCVRVYIWPSFFLWGLDRFLAPFSNRTGKPHVTSDATVTVLAPLPPHPRRRAPVFLLAPGPERLSHDLRRVPNLARRGAPVHRCNAPHWLEDDPLPGDEPASSVKEGSNEEKGGLSRTKETGIDKSKDRPQLKFISASPPMRGFETVVLICGGSGVSFALPLFLDLMQSVGRPSKTNPRCKRVVFVWAVRDPDQLNWIADDWSDMAPAINIRLYVTTAAADTQSFEGEDRPLDASDPRHLNPNPSIARAENIDPTAKDRLLAVPGVQLIYGRPDIKGIVGTEIAEARGAVGITVCGTAELAQSVRNALRDGIARFLDVLRGGPSVLLHVEGFGNT
ncbi:ferric reductase NAD binding domain-containing protein [Mycena leptocephala]|nr:ferric reductase NAD binding domain-containing protein [Mycena leptocephala]